MRGSQLLPCFPFGEYGADHCHRLRVFRVDKPNKFLPEDHSDSVSPPGSFTNSAGNTSSFAKIPTGTISNIGLVPPPVLSIPANAPPADAGQSLAGPTTTTAAAAAEATGQWNGDDLEHGAEEDAQGETREEGEGEYGYEYEYEYEDNRNEAHEGDDHHNYGADGDAYGSWGASQSASFKVEELDSLAATLKGLGLISSEEAELAAGQQPEPQPASIVPS